MLPFILSLLWTALASATCYEPSPAHPPPRFHTDDILLKNAFASIETALNLVVAAPKFDATSFSVEVTSSKESLWSQHHTARERNASRPDIPEVNGDANYRIASITKAFTVLGILHQHAAGNLSLDDTVDNYIHELKEEQKGSIPWKDITLRSLASQLSGLPRECIGPGWNVAQGDIINPHPHFYHTPEELGFPPVSRDGLPECDEYAPNYEPPCTVADLIGAVKSMNPVFAPNQESTYSNVAYELLGLVIGNVTNQTYESYVTEAIFKPLNMTKSSLSPPPDSAGVIPLWPNYWDVDEGIQSPTGGIYTSSSDLSKFLRYILTHYNGVTHAVNWLHPVSPATGLNSFYGMPWEILATDRILLKSRRTVKFITKSGGLPGYVTIIITVPEYDLGITILIAGNFDLLLKAQEVITVGVVRAAEEIAIRQLEERYAGTYASSNPDLNSTITLVADHRGLVVSEFISNATDMMTPELRRIFGGPREGSSYVQLVPTLLFRNETAQEGEQWRIAVVAERTEGEHPVWDDFCMTNVGGMVYAGIPADEIVFWGEKGQAIDTIELSGFRAKLSRQEDDDSENVQSQEEILEL